MDFCQAACQESCVFSMKYLGALETGCQLAVIATRPLKAPSDIHSHVLVQRLILGYLNDYMSLAFWDKLVVRLRRSCKDGNPGLVKQEGR